MIFNMLLIVVVNCKGELVACIGLVWNNGK